MADPPTTREAVEQMRAALCGGPTLSRQSSSPPDETAAVIVADFDDRIKDVESGAVIEQYWNLSATATVTIALAGAPILRAELARYTAMMAFCSRSPYRYWACALRSVPHRQAMLLPLVTALLSVVWALGIMGWLEQPMDTWSAMTPVLILAIAAGHAVQILKRYYEEMAWTHDSCEAVVRSIVAVGPVMLIAGCIAAAGFASLMTFGITSVRSLRVCFWPRESSAR